MIILLGAFTCAYAEKDYSYMTPVEEIIQRTNDKAMILHAESVNNRYAHPDQRFWILMGAVGALILLYLFFASFVFRKRIREIKSSQFESVDERYKKFRRNGNVSQFIY